MTALSAKLQDTVKITRDHSGSASRSWMIGVIGITIGAALLRIAGINRHSFWYDEAVTAQMIHASWSNLLLGGVHDNGNPPIYWLAAKIWAAIFGESEVALRSLSVLATVAAIPFLAILARDLFDRATATIAAALLAISPLMLELGDEARAYALLQLLVIVSTLLLVKWIDRRRRAFLVSYCATICLACLCHYYAIFVPLAHGAFILSSRDRRKNFAPWCVAMMLTAAAGAFWFAAFWTQMHTPDNLSRMGARWRIQFYATPLALAVGRTFVWRDARLLILLAATGAAGLFFWVPAIAGILDRNRRANALLISWAAFPIVFPLIAALLGVPMFHVRAASVALPATLLLVARGFTLLPRPVSVLAAIGLAAMSAVSIANYFAHPLKDDWRSATPVILAQAQSAGAVLFDTSIEAVSFNYYAQRANAEIEGIVVGVVDSPSDSNSSLIGVRFEAGRQIERQARDYSPEIFASPDITLAMCVPLGSIDDYTKCFSQHGFVLAEQAHFHRIDVYHFKHAGQ